MKQMQRRRSLTFELCESRRCLSGVSFTAHSIVGSYHAVGDFDGDGDPDLVVSGGSRFEIKENLGGFESFARHPLLTVPGFQNLQAIDMDQDGDLDIYGNFPNGRYVWHENLGRGTFSSTALSTYRNDVFADLDGDGDLDGIALLELEWLASGRFVWHETVGNEIGFGPRRDLPVAIRPGDRDVPAMAPTLTPIDMDGDGDLDLVATPSQGSHDLVWHENRTGSGDFRAARFIDSVFAAQSTLADFDNDDVVDMIVVHSDGSPRPLDSYRFPSGRLEATSTKIEHYIERYSGGTMIAADVDADGLTDLVGSSSWYRQVPTENGLHFIGDNPFVGRTGVSVHEVLDLDGDGDLDILAASSTHVVWYESDLVQRASADSAMQGDINGDNEVSLADFLILSAHYGKDEATRADGDLDGDERVSFSDFLIVAANFGRTRVEP